MSGCRLHVFNFRNIPHAGIRIGRHTFLGEETLMRGQGGITIGDRVLFGPRVQVLAVNHVMSDPDRPIMDQGITAVGIRIEDGAWIGAGAIVLDGVTIGKQRLHRRRRRGHQPTSRPTPWPSAPRPASSATCGRRRRRCRRADLLRRHGRSRRRDRRDRAAWGLGASGRALCHAASAARG